MLEKEELGLKKREERAHEVEGTMSKILESSWIREGESCGLAEVQLACREGVGRDFRAGFGRPPVGWLGGTGPCGRSRAGTVLRRQLSHVVCMEAGDAQNVRMRGLSRSLEERE